MNNCNYLFRYYEDTKVRKSNRIRKFWEELSAKITEEDRTGKGKEEKEGIIFSIEKFRRENVRKIPAFSDVKSQLESMKTVSNRSATLAGMSDYLKCYSICAINMLEFHMINSTRQCRYNRYIAKYQVNIFIIY